MATLESRKSMEEEFKKGKIPFALDKSEYNRFSERDMIFSRVMWDESFPSYRRAIGERENEKVGLKGYSREGYAASDAAWTVYDEFQGAFRWEPEEQAKTLTQKDSKLPKFDESDLRENSKIVKRIGKVFGACDVGVTELDPDKPFIYTHNRANEPLEFPEGIKYAIVMLIEMDYHALKTSPALPASITTGNGYSRMAFAIACMAKFLRNLGYKAIPAGNDTGISVPLAVQAGLGQFGRNGLLIHPKFGQSVRICKVYTDFPLEADQAIDMGVTQFCRICKKCAQYCPSQSIPYDTDPTWESPWNSVSNNDGVLKWFVNVETCYEYWVKNSSDCSNCIRVCPFTKPPGIGHDFARFFIKRFPALNPLWLKIDNIMALFPWWRYGKKENPENFWSSKKYLGK
jgi:reductive dehalogenase